MHLTAAAEIHKIAKLTKCWWTLDSAISLFSNKYVLLRTQMFPLFAMENTGFSFLFSKNLQFSWDAVLVILKMFIFVFWKRIFRNRNRFKNSFYVFVFSVYASDKHTFDDEKTENHTFFIFLKIFHHSKTSPWKSHPGSNS